MYAEGDARGPGAVGAVPSCGGLEGAESQRPVNACAGAPGNGSQSEPPDRGSGSLDTMEVPAGAALALRLLIAAVYLTVCAVGLVGNVLVMVLVRARQRRRPSALNCFVLNLAATDFQFVLTLPFWAVDTARDFSWPFGSAMCKIVLSMTVLNMYASAFFLSAMSIARYFTVAGALRRYSPDGRDAACCGAATPVWVCGLLWVAASLATMPTALFSTVASVAGERLCLLRFPDGSWDWLALYHVQKITVAFLLPLATLSACYLLLVRFLRRRPRPWLRGPSGPSGPPPTPRRPSRVTRSVTVVVLAFFLCWLPNHAITLWGVLVKFNAVPWDRAYYLVHSYLFPVTICLAHANSCLNPLLYCLLRPEFRQLLWELCCRRCGPSSSRPAKGGPASAATGPAQRRWRSSSCSEPPPGGRV
ncbi:relaxin-3 receptor 1-like [Sarcophilus harrisii]|uniref:relaxin-3 receptor 1-like n=1 Tax=Sarcophilus harrisii TaxID=9305 RepID=UPI001301FC0C|nr:relaxin-3 receptor 1-like [Sarcophilus harrisii]